jgi:hypothetical protein
MVSLQKPKNHGTWYSVFKKNIIGPKKITLMLTGADPSKDALALENDKFPAKNEPPFWKTFWGVRPSAGHP